VARAAKDAPITAQLVGFVRLLRANGFAPGLAEAQDAVRTAAADDLLRPQLLRYGLRALLCSCERDWRHFDELYDLYWFGLGHRQAKVSAGGANRRRSQRTGPRQCTQHWLSKRRIIRCCVKFRARQSV
jgi:uncharacterized protein with von Willebrand factor type A (vWA) domain